jgi:DNA-binding transcriptional LysR family regulator
VNWLAESGRRAGAARRGSVEVNSLPAMLLAVRSGLGLAALPDYMGSELDDLIQVLPDLKAPRIDAYFVYPEEMRHSKRVAVFRDFLVAELSTVGGGAGGAG